jgi:hypothetical protein
MKGLGFPEKWITWVMSTVKKGKLFMNVTRERSNYFSTFKGLRHGDPLSPWLFNLVADLLGIMLNKAITKGHIRGVLVHLVPGGFLIFNTQTTLLL